MSCVVLLVTFPFCFAKYGGRIHPADVAVGSSVERCCPVGRNRRLRLVFAVAGAKSTPLVVSRVRPSYKYVVLSGDSRVVVPRSNVQRFGTACGDVGGMNRIIRHVHVFKGVLPRKGTRLGFSIGMIPSTSCAHSCRRLCRSFGAGGNVIERVMSKGRSRLKCCMKRPWRDDGLFRKYVSLGTTFSSFAY